MNVKNYDYEELSELLDEWSVDVSHIGATVYPGSSPSGVFRSYKEDRVTLPKGEDATSSQEEESIHQSISSTGQRITKTLSGTQRFNLSEVLGEGTFGRVWRADDNDLNRRVAIKGFKGPIEQAKTSCISELKYVGGLDHPSIPTVYDTGLTEDGVPFVVMKFIDGESLTHIIDRLRSGDAETHRHFSFERRVGLIISLLKATQSAHDQGVLHRDIKPDNILVSSDGHLWLIDWGCAVSIEDVKESSGLSGTPLYMPPEQVLKGSLSVASDLFAIASVAYEFLSLHRAGPPTTQVKETLKAILTHQPKLLYEMSHPTQGYVPAEYSGVIMQALERSPARRPKSANEMIRWFERQLSGDIEIVCARTLLKSRLCRLMTWVNQDPYPRMRYIKFTVVGITLMMMGIGALAASLLL